VNALAKRINFELSAALADAAAPSAMLHTILDDLSVGIVLLDSENRVRFVNRVFRRIWRISDTYAESHPSFADMLYHGRGKKASAASHHRLGEYITKQMDLIRAGEQGPLQIRLSNGDAIQFRCKALPDGGRLLTYGNVSELTRQSDALERLASVDAMTGVANRRHFLSCADMEWDRHKRYGGSLAVLMIDIDRFKSVNDQYGHDAGDVVIKAMADTLKKSKRATDIVGRLGGEEFALLLLEATLDNAAKAGERFRQLVADRDIVADGRHIPVTISVGVSVSRPETSGIRELLKQADVALYEAKHSGRNRVCRFNPDQPSDKAAG
jgi:diguanylate cyclase (GGDEF)-like protein